ncbi:MAG: cysteine-rich CWC family protein [Betaproteobacteria bacterium]
MENQDGLRSCVQCSAEFACGMGGPAPCWCSTEFPPAIGVPQNDAGCLCPACLRARIAEATGSPKGAT